MKDYYKILNISSSATSDEVKKAFRKLALKYHPDKTNGSTGSSERFSEIQEAYAVLSNSRKRSEYHYSRYRETARSKPMAETAEDVVVAADELKKKIVQFDPFRIDRDLVYFELKDLLRPHNIHLLQENADQARMVSFTKLVLECFTPLDFERTKELCDLLSNMANADSLSQKLIMEYLTNSYLLHIWNRYKAFFALLISALLCFSIFWLTRKK